MADVRIQELSEKIERLSQDMDRYQHQISLLREELQQISNGEKKVPVKPVLKEKLHTPLFFDIESFIGLKLIHFIGIIVLITGLTIGVKYAIDVNLVSPAVRILSAYFAGALMLVTALRLRKKYELFSVILFSGAMASVYFTTFAAFEYYHLLTRWAAFALMLLITMFTVFASVRSDHREIAILGLVGAYAIPFFVGNNTGDIGTLFTYILLINTGVMFISFRKYWLSLTYISFIITWMIFISTLVARRDEQYFATELTFAIIFYSLFMVNCLVFKLVKGMKLDVIDTAIITFNTMLLYFTFSILFTGYPDTIMENITIVMGAIYLLAAAFTRKYIIFQYHLTDSLFSIALAAFVIYAAMRYEGFSVTITWILMAVVYFLAGMYYRLKSFRVASILLFAATLFKLLLIDSSRFSSVEKIIAYLFTGVVLLVVSFLYQKYGKRVLTNEES